jgi:Leucine-rich repeat (LRR) protein
MTLSRLVSFTAVCVLAGSAFAHSSPLPSFDDPKLQACFNELRAANGWQQAEDVKVLKCPERGIRWLGGLEGLTELEELDLSDNRIESLYPAAYVLTKLRRLSLSGNRAIPLFDLLPFLSLNWDLTHIGLRDILIEDLSQLHLWDPRTGGPYALQELDLANTGIGSVFPLSQFWTLESLNVRDNELRSLSGLENLAALQKLDLSNNRVATLYQLQGTKLTELRLSGNRELALYQINPVLARNPDLTRLALGQIPVGHLSALSLQNQQTGEPYALVELDLSETGIGALHRLVDFPTIRTLNLAGNGLEDYALAPLSLLSELESLDLSHNRLRYLYDLQLDSLTELRLSGNRGIDLYNLDVLLRSNRGLTRLGLADIPIRNLWELSLRDLGTGLPYRLVELDLRNTRIRDLYPLTDFPELRVLDLSENYVVDVAALGVLQELRELDLSDNRIRELWSMNQTKLTHLDLGGNPGLEWWDASWLLFGNPLTHLGLRDMFIEDFGNLPLYDQWGMPPSLVELDVSGTAITSLNFLSSYPLLERIDLSRNRIQELGGVYQWSRVKKLDLSETRVYELYSLNSARRLRELRLDECVDVDMWSVREVLTKNPFLERIALSGLPVKDLWSLPLQDWQTGSSYTLVELDLSSAGITDVSRLAYFPYLETLRLRGNSIQDGSALAGMPRLRSLDLGYNPTFDLGSLSSTTGLTHLDLSGISSINLSWLHQVLWQNTKLTRLSLRDIPLQNLWSLPLDDYSLGEPYRLVELDVSNTQIDIASVSRLETFRDLEVLRASGNSFFDFTGFQPQNHTRLRELDLGETNLQTPARIHEFTSLERLDLSGNGALQPNWIPSMLVQNVFLTDVDLSGIPIQADITSFLVDWQTGRSYDLESLRLAKTGLIDLTPLSRLSTYDLLVELDLSGNQLKDATELSSLTQLRRLDLSKNHLVSVEALSSLRRLEVLNVSGNPNVPLGELHLVLQFNPRLAHIGLSHIPIPNLYVLPPLTNPFDYRLFELELDNVHPDHLGPLTNQPLLRRLSLRDNDLDDVSALFSLSSLTRLDLSGNPDIPCNALDVLETILGSSAVIRPSDCFVPNTPPVVEILSPANGSSFQSTVDISFEARASDAEDGDLSAAVTWSSNLSGVLGTGRHLVRKLTAGNHRITARVTDSLGAAKTASVDIIVTGPLAYCSSFAQSTSYEWIQAVSVGGFSMASGDNRGYGDFRGLGPIPLAPGATPVVLTPGFRSSSYTENWSAWIDFNRDGSFASTERVFSGASTNALSGSIVVPATALSGETRMRVSMRWGSAPSACGSFTWGEVEDYTVTIAK